MIKINKKTEYALMALKYMADKGAGTLTTARELCDHFSTPFDTTAKVLQVMNQKGILKSTKGINGGYELQKSLQDISFQDFARLIEGAKSSDHFCISAKGRCDLHGTCNIADPLERLNQKIQQYLTTVTLQDLLISEQFYNISEHI